MAGRVLNTNTGNESDAARLPSGPDAFPGLQPEAARHSPVTVIGLFEDRIDAEDALVAMRRAQEPSDQVSVLIRASPHAGGSGEDADAITRALMTTDLDAVGGWLRGLTSLIVPERGTYLVAGPLGAALAGIAIDHAPLTEHPNFPTPRAGEAVSLLHTFVEFGFGNDEASYLEHRLAAGAVMVAVTTPARDTMQSTRRLFADYNAVHIGQARTNAHLAAEASALLAAAPEASHGGDVVVADSVAAMSHLCNETADDPIYRGVCGADVIDPSGRGTGVVLDVLGEMNGPSPATVRYIVVGFGGLLGLGRHLVAVPRELVDVSGRPVQVTIERETVRRGPRFDPNGPFSRRQEAAVCAYFGVATYWG